jgi:hypothetical protein
MDWIHIAQDTIESRALVNRELVMGFGMYKECGIS